MSRYFRRLHGRTAPPGLEWALLRRMPLVFLAGTLALPGLSLLARLQQSGVASAEAAKQIASVDIFVIAALFTFWTGVVTVTIGCIVVYVMKGPAYVADAYPLRDAPRPAPKDRECC